MLLTIDKLNKYWEQIKNLLLYCKKSSSGEIMTDDFCQKKLLQLFEYLKQNKAYFFVELENEVVQGFLWGCVIQKNLNKRFHVLYFAVLPQYQKSGIGKRLLETAEKQAKKMGIKEIELNVHVKNELAIRFYSKYQYIVESKYLEERFTLKKNLL